MATSLTVGDVVELKSGGPKMTVTWVGVTFGAPMVRCIWFDETETKKIQGDFTPDALQIAQPRKEGPSAG